MNAADLLAIWEHGRQLAPLRRARLFSALEPADTRGAPLPMGASGARMLHLRRRLFGSDIAAIAHCPTCDAALELSMQVEDFLAAANDDILAATHSVDVDGRTLHFRLPTLEDLEAIDPSLPIADAQTQLLLACVSDHDRAHAIHAEAALLTEIARSDPLADPHLALSCEACDEHFTVAFDIAAFLWREIEAWSARLMADVHTIASSYGWSEAEILALTPTRRQVYLDLICA
ncbi:hypothetical protein [Dyella silvatica]|uniref:hypothetical protein n=1 Tax=Dyella silvatica TaxID=2992128 RepID=UPI00224F951A|nr:hypothetical protein [Dyella silvatica]